MTFRTAIFGVLFALCSVGTAYADDARFGGVYLGIHGGKSFANTEIEAVGSPLAIDGLGSDGMTGGVHLGYDHQFGRFVVGALVEWNGIGKTEFEVAPILSYEIQQGLLVAGRAGVVIGNAMPYVLVGWAKTEAEVSLLGTSVYKYDADGLALGAGIDLKLDDMAKGLVLGIRYLNIETDSHDIGGAGVAKITNSIDRVDLRLSYKFDFGGSSASLK